MNDKRTIDAILSNGIARRIYILTVSPVIGIFLAWLAIHRGVAAGWKELSWSFRDDAKELMESIVKSWPSPRDQIAHSIREDRQSRHFGSSAYIRAKYGPSIARYPKRQPPLHRTLTRLKGWKHLCASRYRYCSNRQLKG